MPTTQSQAFLTSLTRRSDIALALLLVSIIAMMILPMPPLMLDLLIGLNMSIAILLLMVSIYIPSPLAFATFPSVLLLTTLFRLSLGIASTRLILLDGEAGKIIQTFGEFVVGGNLVVGLVVFLIITIVQFIVITKGSERIAEVSARFSLDAMPGKQMSIDSDLRAGVITLAEARRRRENLALESQLFGSMDGAMKFVKGDAIAGLIIILVNILGGLTIGTLQRGMPMSDALQLYSILTIGDGLVAQIPALFISITSGIIVTRVTQEEQSNLGTDIGKQLLGQPSALLAASGIVAAMGAIPGFPTMVFLFLGGLLGAAWMALRKVQTQMAFADDEVTTLIGQEYTTQLAQLTTENKLALDDMQPPAPVLVELPTQIKTQFSMEALNQEFVRLRREFYQDLGIPLPGINLRLTAPLEADTYRISIRSIPVAQGKFQTALANISGIATSQALQIATSGLVTQARAPTPELTDGIEAISYHLSYLLRRHAAEFIGIQELHGLYGKLEQAGYMELVREAQRALNTTKTVDVLRRLLNEGISIRDLRQILEVLVEFGETEKDMGMLTERVRASLRRQIVYTFTNGTAILPVYLFAPETERLLQTNLRQSPTGIFFALAPEIMQQWTHTLRQLEEQQANTPTRPVILTSVDLRRHVRRHLESTFTSLPVLSIQELTPTISLNPVGEIRLT